MNTTCMSCLNHTATERLGWEDEDSIVWYSFLCPSCAETATTINGTPDIHDQQVPAWTRS